MILRTLSGPAAWLIERIKSIPRWMLCVVGSVLLCGGLVLAAMVERKDLAVALTFATSVIGTAILSLYLPKLLASVIDDEREKARLFAEKLKAETAARQVQERLREAEREIGRLERMQLSLQAFTPIANLSLLSVEMIIKDFLPKKLEPKHQPKFIGIPIGRFKQASYFGAIEIPVKALLGVDLQKVHIKPHPDGRLIVSGLSMSTTADTGRGADWQLSEVRTEVYSDDKVTRIEIDPHDERLLEERVLHEKQLRGRINAGQSFTVFEKPLLHAARQAITLFLAPFEREIIFAGKVPPDSRPLMEFLVDQQRALAEQIKDRRKALDGTHAQPAMPDQPPGPATPVA